MFPSLYREEIKNVWKDLTVYLISVSLNELWIYLVDRTNTKHGFISFHQNNQKQKDKTKGKLPNLLPSPPFQLISVSYHIPLFSPNFFFKPTESTLCYQHAHFCKVIHLWGTCQCLHAYGKLNQSSGSLANSSLVIEDFYESVHASIVSGMTLYKSYMSTHSCRDCMCATALECTKKHYFPVVTHCLWLLKSSPSIHYLSLAEC